MRSSKEIYATRTHRADSGPDIGQEELKYEADGPPATVRGWDYSRTRFTLASDSDADVAASNDDLASDRRYPTEAELKPLFAKTLDDLYSRQDRLAAALLTGFEAALELPSRTLTDMFEGGDFGTIRLLHYPGDARIQADARQVGIAAHTDFECFTLMHQNAAGLQLMPRSPEGGHGPWIDAPVRDAEFIVIIGDMLERLTNGGTRD